MKQAAFFYIKSDTDKNKTYTVRLTPDGQYLCNCPHFLFRNKECKHIYKVKHPHFKPPETTLENPPTKRYGKKKLTWDEMLAEVKKMGNRAKRQRYNDPVQQAVYDNIF